MATANGSFSTGDYVQEVYRSRVAVGEIDDERELQRVDLLTSQNHIYNMYLYWNTIATYLRAIQEDFDVIEARMDLIEDSITVFKTLGTNCNLGIYGTNGRDDVSRALTMMSLRDNQQYEQYKEYLDDPNYTDDQDFFSVIGN